MEWITYVPEWNGNRTDKNPVTVEILPLTVREARRQSKGIIAKRVKGGFKTNQAEISEKQFLSHIREIKNLDEGGKPITTAEELLDSRYVDLANEIEEAISDVSMLSEGDLKNFELRSDGYLAPAHGTVGFVTNKGSETGTAAENTQ